MADYVPTTETIYESYEVRYGTFSSRAEFNRWLAEHDRQIAERVWLEGWAAHDYAITYREVTLNPYRQGEEQ